MTSETDQTELDSEISAVEKVALISQNESSYLPCSDSVENREKKGIRIAPQIGDVVDNKGNTVIGENNHYIVNIKTDDDDDYDDEDDDINNNIPDDNEQDNQIYNEQNIMLVMKLKNMEKKLSKVPIDDGYISIKVNKKKRMIIKYVAYSVSVAVVLLVVGFLFNFYMVWQRIEYNLKYFTIDKAIIVDESESKPSLDEIPYVFNSFTNKSVCNLKSSSIYNLFHDNTDKTNNIFIKCVIYFSYDDGMGSDVWEVLEENSCFSKEGSFDLNFKATCKSFGRVIESQIVSKQIKIDRTMPKFVDGIPTWVSIPYKITVADYGSGIKEISVKNTSSGVVETVNKDEYVFNSPGIYTVSVFDNANNNNTATVKIDATVPKMIMNYQNEFGFWKTLTLSKSEQPSIYFFKPKSYIEAIDNESGVKAIYVLYPFTDKFVEHSVSKFIFNETGQYKIYALDYVSSGQEVFYINITNGSDLQIYYPIKVPDINWIKLNTILEFSSKNKNIPLSYLYVYTKKIIYDDDDLINPFLLDSNGKEKKIEDQVEEDLSIKRLKYSDYSKIMIPIPENTYTFQYFLDKEGDNYIELVDIAYNVVTFNANVYSFKPVFKGIEGKPYINKPTALSVLTYGPSISSYQVVEILSYTQNVTLCVNLSECIIDGPGYFIATAKDVNEYTTELEIFYDNKPPEFIDYKPQKTVNSCYNIVDIITYGGVPKNILDYIEVSTIDFLTKEAIGEVKIMPGVFSVCFDKKGYYKVNAYDYAKNCATKYITIYEIEPYISINGTNPPLDFTSNAIVEFTIEIDPLLIVWEIIIKKDDLLISVESVCPDYHKCTLSVSGKYEVTIQDSLGTVSTYNIIVSIEN